MHDLEHRSLVECRVTLDEKGRYLDAMPIVFNSRSVDLGGFVEIIAPEAVDRTLKQGADVRALVDHDAAKILARTRAGTLTLRKQTDGLRARIEPDPQISYVADILRSIERGDVSGMSFGFRAIDDEWNFEEDPPLRTIWDMDVREISVVTFPAYEATNVDVAKRSLDAAYTNYKGSRLAWLRRLHTLRSLR